MRQVDGNEISIKSLGWGMLVVVVGLIGLIWWGVFDPRPLVPTYEWDYVADECETQLMAAFAETGTILLNLPADVPTEIVLEGGLRLAILPVGFVELGIGDTLIRPLGTFPHVAQLGNEVWIDVVDGTAVLIRINREIYWKGEIKLSGEKMLVSCLK